ncbi:hypothetical protein HQ590_00625 [bacterium]|nr:hypothetical protein [bacterium]
MLPGDPHDPTGYQPAGRPGPRPRRAGHRPGRRPRPDRARLFPRRPRRPPGRLPGDPVGLLVEELIAAHQRGVRVRVVLEDSKAGENEVAYRRLREHGIDVRFDAAVHLLHTKAVVVDRRRCLVGSANWSRAAFQDNHELSLQIESPALAEQILVAFDQVALRSEPSPAGRPAAGVPVPRRFLLAGGAGSRMVTDRADAAFQMYLLLASGPRRHQHRRLGRRRAWPPATVCQPAPAPGPARKALPPHPLRSPGPLRDAPGWSSRARCSVGCPSPQRADPRPVG